MLLNALKSIEMKRINYVKIETKLKTKLLTFQQINKLSSSLASNSLRIGDKSYVICISL